VTVSLTWDPLFDVDTVEEKHHVFLIHNNLTNNEDMPTKPLHVTGRRQLQVRISNLSKFGTRMDILPWEILFVEHTVDPSLLSLRCQESRQRTYATACLLFA
jgi:hypothetical protein